MTEQIEMRSDLSGTIETSAVRANTSTRPKIRGGIVGAGLMGRWHGRAIKKAGGEVVGVADIDEKQAARLAAEFPSAQGFGNVAEMLSKNSFDVLHVCTPLSSHRAIAELAIKAGINLIIEKPLAQTTSETIRLYDLAANHNVRLYPVHQFAFQSGVKKARELMPQIGEIVHLEATICSAGGEGLDTDQLDSIAADILPHPLSLFQVVLNNLLPEENWKVVHPRKGELRVNGYAYETSLSIFISMSSRPTNNSLKILGTKGAIYVDLFHGFAVMETGEVSKTRKILRPLDLAVRTFFGATFNLMRRAVLMEAAYPGLQQLVSDFYHSLRQGSEPAITPQQAINVARIRDLLMRSAEIDQPAGN